MGSEFIRGAFGIWAISRIFFVHRRRMRKQAVQALAADYHEQRGTFRVLTGRGVVATHEVADLFSGYAVCTLAVDSVMAGRSEDVTCRACLRIHQRAVRVAMDLEGAANG